MTEYYAQAPTVVTRIIAETPHGLFIEGIDNVFWMVPKNNATPCRQVVPVQNYFELWARTSRHDA